LADFDNFWQATSGRNLTQMSVVLVTSPLCCRYTTLWNAGVVVWPLTTMNSYWVAHTSAQKLLS